MSVSKRGFQMYGLCFVSQVFIIDAHFFFFFFFYTDEEVLNEEELDKELLWNLQLLSEVI